MISRARLPLVLVLLGVLSAWLGSIAPAGAQACSTDFQCSPNPSGYNVCLGDTLIMRRRLCVGGQCVEQEMGRVNCGSGSIGGTCQGNSFVRSGNRCDAAAGRCAQGGSIAVTCVQSCTCVGRTLTISTGICTPGAGCGRTVMRCKVGCTCAPEPRCTEDPPPKGATAPAGPPIKPEAAKAAAAARAANELPPRMAEPFEAEPPPRTTVTPAKAKGKAKKRKKRRT